MNQKLKLTIISVAFGLAWGFIYLIFSLMHSMTKMFNYEFIFLVANIFNVNVSTVFKGFIFSFIDGLLAGLIVGLFINKLTQHLNENDDL